MDFSAPRIRRVLDAISDKTSYRLLWYSLTGRVMPLESIETGDWILVGTHLDVQDVRWDDSIAVNVAQGPGRNDSIRDESSERTSIDHSFAMDQAECLDANHLAGAIDAPSAIA